MDNRLVQCHTLEMPPSVEQTVRDHKRAAKALMKEIGKDPEKAKAYLIHAGILVRSAKSPNGVQLAKAFRRAN